MISNHAGFNRMVRICFMIISGAGGVLGLARLFRGEWIVALPGLAIASAALLSLFFVKKTEKVVRALYLLTFVFCLGQVLSMIKGGGLYSPSMVWFSAMPIVAMVLPRRKSIRMCLAFVLVLSFFYWGPLWGWVEPGRLDISEAQLTFRYVIAILSVLTTLAAASVLKFGYTDMFTELLRREQELQEITRKAKEGEARLQDTLKERNSLLRMLTHDLATPIMSVELSLHHAQRNMTLTPEIVQRMKLALASMKEMGGHVRELTALESGKVSRSDSAVDLRQRLLDIHELIKPALKAKNIDFQILAPAEPMMVFAQEIYLKNIFMNLLSNAIKFSKSQGKIRVVCECSKNHVRVSVSDEGIGIPEELISQIFSFDKKTSRLGTDGEKGTGYGLPLVMSYVKALGGAIEVQSQPQGPTEKASGTVFHVTFPLARDFQTLVKKSA